MRIGINALYLIPGKVGGTEIYLRNLLSALAELDNQNEYFIFTAREAGSDVVPANPRFHSEVQSVSAVNRPSRLLWEQSLLALRVRSLQLDCLLNCGFTAPIVQSCPNVTVFHDLQHKRHPEYFSAWHLPAWRFFLWAAAHRSQALIADSDATKADLLLFYRLREQAITVVPLGVEAKFFDLAWKRNVTEPFFLCASTLHPHKNLERLIEAFHQFSRQRSNYQLVITGLKGFHTEAITSLIDRLQCGNKVRLTGWIPRNELYAYFQKATAFFYPSTFEGFGLPVVEAMAAGVPLACSEIEPLRSIAGNSALLFAPGDTEAVVNAMVRLASDEPLRQSLSAAGRERAKLFTWEACARKTLQVLEAAYRSKSSS